MKPENQSYSSIDDSLLKDAEKHDQRYFAMLNNAVALSNTSLEGGQVPEALAYYWYLLNLNLPNCPVNLNLSEQQVIALKRDIGNLIRGNTFLETNYKNSKLNTPECLDEIISTIKVVCNKYGVWYYPSGWRGSRGAHFAGLKLRKLKNYNHVFCLINLGGGIEYHQLLSKSGDKEKYCYQSEEYEINLDSNDGRELLQKLIELRYDLQQSLDTKKAINPYSEHDLYGLLKLYGEELPLTDEKRNEKSVTPQRTGTCSVTNIHAIARDILIDLDAFPSWKRYHFVIKLRSLIAGFYAYRQGCYAHNLLDWALREFSLRVNKYNHLLSDEEVIYCGKLQKEIQARLDQDKKIAIQKKCIDSPFPEVKAKVSDFGINIFSLLKPIEKFEFDEKKPNAEIIPTNPINITPTTIRGILKSYASPENKFSFKNLYDFFNALPHCTGQKEDPFWDQVPEIDIDWIINGLYRIIKTLKSSPNDSALHRGRSFALALIAYDIAAQLTPRDEGCRLCDAYILGLDDVYSTQCFFIDPLVYYTIKRIVINFDLRSQNKGRVLTNTVNYRNKKDETIYYIIRVLLNESQRQIISKAIKINTGMKKQSYSDEELFDYLIKNPYLRDDENNCLLNHIVLMSIQLSATAHALGNFVVGYQKTKDHHWYFDNSQFHQEFIKQEKSYFTEIYKYFPEIKKYDDLVHQDFSENTIYHPRKDLKKLQEKYKDSKDFIFQPYQIYLSGSLRSTSITWGSKTQIHEELDEDFRHIECTPNLQIVRVLSWASVNLSKLSIREVRARISEILFQYGKLDSALANNFKTTGLVIEDFLVASLKYCQEKNINDFELVIWLADIAYNLRYYLEVAAKLYKFSLADFNWPSYRELLLQSITHTHDINLRSKLASQFVMSYRNSNPLSVRDCCLLLTCRIIANLGNDAYLSDEVWQSFNQELIAMITKEQAEVIKDLPQLLSRYLNEKAIENWQFRDSKLFAVGLDLVLDLTEGKLKKKDAKEIKDCTEKTIAANQALFSHLNLTSAKITLLYSSSLTSKQDERFNNTKKILKSADDCWEFIGTRRSSSDLSFDIDDTFQLFTIEGIQAKFKLLRAKEVFKNPFESEAMCETHYQYWQSVDNDRLVFVRQKNSEIAYYFSYYYSYDYSINPLIYQLKLAITGNWQRTGQLLLNLVNPKTELEIQWSKKLVPLFGAENIRCLAKLSDDGLTCTLESIEHLALGLSFIPKDDKQLTCKEFPGYVLSSQQGIEVLNGLPSVLILENSAGKKYLIPAFSLNKGEANNSFNHKDILDYGSFCNPTPPYYFYSFNRDKELIGESIEANLYLAILYRSQGDFAKAFKYLNRCKNHQNITAVCVKIVLQVLIRKIKSPLGAAFDLKLACYIKEHQVKWSKNSEQVLNSVEIPDAWKKWVLEQLQFYKETFSAYKEGIAIIPSYCRLTDFDLALLSQEVSSLQKKNLNCSEIFFHNERLEKIKRLPSFSGWKNTVSWIQYNFERAKENCDGLRDNFSTLRFYAEGKNQKPAYNYLIFYFDHLFYEAISGNYQKLYRRLFSLLQNDSDFDNHPDDLYTLIALLIFASKHRNYFSAASFNYHNNFDVMRVAGEIFHNHWDEIKNTEIYLLPTDKKPKGVTVETSLPHDFIPKTLEFKIGTIYYEKECRHPLGIFIDSYFVKQQVPIAQHEFLLELSGLQNPTPLEIKLFNHYKSGHKQNQNKFKNIYSFKQEKNLTDLRLELTELQQQDQTRLALLKESLLTKANQTPVDILDSTNSEKAKAYNLLLARASEQRQIIVLSDLFFAFLQQKPSLLAERNYFLSQEDIEKLFSELVDYALLQSRVDQIQQVLEIINGKSSVKELDSYELQLVGSILDKTRIYNFAGYPEFLVYEYAARRVLREDQVKILIKLINLIETDSNNNDDMPHGLLQFAAGGGKSSVLIPILAQRFARKGYLPVIIFTNELYQIGLEDIPKNLRDNFEKYVEVVECELEHVWTEDELKKLLGDLERWRNEGKCLFIKSVTWHSINLAKKFGYVKRDISLGKAAEAILEFFNNKAVKLEDECQIISNPLQQSIKTYGERQKIPAEQLTLLLRYYDYLMGYEKNSQDISELAGISIDRKRSINPQELTTLQHKLAEVIIHESVFKDIDSNELFKYLVQTSKKRPAWLVSLHERDKKLADLILLARAFIKTHLPHILSLQYSKNYGESIHPGDLTVAPKHDGERVTSHYRDYTLVIALTIQLYLQRGLSASQTEQLLDQLLEKHHEERLSNTNLMQPTQAEQFLFQVIPDNYQFSSYRDLTLEIKTKLAEDLYFFKNPQVIKKFLQNFALTQIEIPEGQQTSTAPELQADFRSLLFSATPELRIIYPVFLKEENCFLEESFEAQVIDALLERNTEHFELALTQTPTEFFRQIPTRLLQEMTTLIDRGALLTNFKVEEIIESYLELDGTVIKTAAAFSEAFSDDHMFLKSKEANIKNMRIAGASLNEALRSQGIDPEKFLLFLFLDLRKTTGTDIKRPYRDHAGLTVGREQTVTETIQAAMRERQLLDDNAQSITWLMFQSLYQEINAGAKADRFDLRQVFYWMIKNQARQIEEKVKARAYQGIDQILQAIAWEDVKKNYHYFDSYHFLKAEVDLSPYNIYEIDSIEQDTKIVLTEYLKNLTYKLGFKKVEDLPPKPKALVAKIIQETSELIATLPNFYGPQLGVEVQQEQKMEMQQEQQQQQQIQMQFDKMSGFKFALEQYFFEKDNFTTIFNKNYRNKNKRYQELQLPHCDSIKQQKLLFCPEHFVALQTETANKKSQLSQLKPIKMLLVQITFINEIQFLACTATGAEYYSFLLNDRFLTRKDPAYALISIHGAVLHISSNTSVLECKQFIKTSLCQKMLRYVQFLTGKSNLASLKQLIIEQAWSMKDFQKLAEEISNIHISHSSLSLLDKDTLSKLFDIEDGISEKTLITNLRYQNYRPEKSQQNKNETQILRPLTVLENHIESTQFIVTYPKVALEGYLFGLTPNPMGKNREELELCQLINETQSLPINNVIKEKQLAINKLNEQVKDILKSIASLSDKLNQVQTLYKDFKELDKNIEELNINLQSYQNSVKYLMVAKALALSAANNAYFDYAEGHSVNRCKLDLRFKLENLAIETEKQYQEKSLGRFIPKTLFFSSSKFQSTLAEIIYKSATHLTNSNNILKKESEDTSQIKKFG